MTSEERKEARFQRRRARRQAKRMARSRACGDFEEIFSYENLYKSGNLCARNVGWKHSTQSYRFNLVTNIARTRKELLEGSFKSKGFVEFDLCERGKMRHIRSIHISERVVQRTLCDKAIIPTFAPSFIYDNGASLAGKGIIFALNRITCQLERFYRKHGNDGYVLLYDFSSYFDRANHAPVQRELERRVHDARVRALANQCLEAFGPVGYGLGSQISQISAIMLPNKLDHMIKEELRIKGYGRYMDDGYLIHHDKAYLEHCLDRIREVCAELDIVLNPKKTRILRLKDGFPFLKIKFRMTESGKIVKRMAYKSVKTMRRKLKKFKQWNENGRYLLINNELVRKEFTLQEICNAYSSWRSHASWGNNYWIIHRMDAYFASLFGVHPADQAEWAAVFNRKGVANVQN